MVICMEEVQMICIWSSWCHCHPTVSCLIKIQIGFTFLASAYPGFPGKEAAKRVSVCLVLEKNPGDERPRFFVGQMPYLSPSHHVTQMSSKD